MVKISHPWTNYNTLFAFATSKSWKPHHRCYLWLMAWLIISIIIQFSFSFFFLFFAVLFKFFFLQKWLGYYAHITLVLLRWKFFYSFTYKIVDVILGPLINLALHFIWLHLLTKQKFNFISTGSYLFYKAYCRYDSGSHNITPVIWQDLKSALTLSVSLQ